MLCLEPPRLSTRKKRTHRPSQICKSVKRTRIKICGITRTEDALAAEALGADALGFVFVERSKRKTDVSNAATISKRLGPFVQRVGLFLDAPAIEVREALQVIPGLIPQFHGREDAEYCDSFDCDYLKAIGVGEGPPEAASLGAFQRCQGFLFDSNAPGQLGGTGHTFNWDMLNNMSTVEHLILAGGLAAENVAEAIVQVRPYAVDVSTGVEVSPGVKDTGLIEKFIDAVEGADLQLRGKHT